MLRQKALQQEDIVRLSNIVESMSTTIANIRSSTIRPAADEVIHKPSYIAEVVELNKSIEEAIKRLQLILNIFSAPYNMDQETNEAALVPRNTENLKSRLTMTEQYLQEIVPARSDIQESRILFEPDDRIVRLMQEMNQRPGLFIQANPRAIAQVMNVLNDYLRSFIEATQLGVYANILSTSNKISELKRATEGVEEQKMEAEAFGITDHEEIRKNWIEILYMVEFTLANLYTRLNEIYGPSAAWLLDQVEVDALKKFYRQLIDKEKILKQELGGGEENGLFDKMKEALTSLMKARKEPPRSKAQIQEEINQNSGTKKRVRDHILKRGEK